MNNKITYLFFSGLMLLAGCATPVSVRHVNPEKVHRALTTSVLSNGKLSGPTENLLFRRGLAELYRKAPAQAIARLHEHALLEAANNPEFYALAELSFHHAEHGGGQPYYLAAALYAWAYLFPKDPAYAPNPYDPRLSLACNFYNRGLTEAFCAPDGREVVMRAGVYELPFGRLTVTLDPAEQLWAGRRLDHFVPVSDLEIKGLNNRYRRPGLGAPLAADSLTTTPEQRVDPYVAQKVKVPVAAVLWLDDAREQIARGRMNGQLKLYPDDVAETIAVEGRTVPLAEEPTAALAFTLADPAIWRQELSGFFHGDFSLKEQTRLISLSPYRPGLIPVVLVHGTASTHGRWANLVNELENDPRIRDRFQFWFFYYDTGNPIPYSAMLLREELTQAVARFDPDGRDPALRRMIVIGHSQGGLLTKMTAIDSGDRLWRTQSGRTPDELHLSARTRDLLARSYMVKPLPFVQRVVYIATPHRGSYLAGWGLTQWLATRLIKLPKDVVDASADIVKASAQALTGQIDAPGQKLKRLIPTSLRDMMPGGSFSKALAEIPVTPAVHVHSIVAVKGEGTVERGNDGVVEYRSAHLPEAESELVVRSGHSCQSNVEVIGEIRRILVEHLVEPGPR